MGSNPTLTARILSGSPAGPSILPPTYYELNALFSSFPFYRHRRRNFLHCIRHSQKQVRRTGLMFDVFGIRVPTIDRSMDGVLISVAASMALLIVALLLFRAWRKQLRANKLGADKQRVLEQQIIQAVLSSRGMARSAV